MYPTRPKLRRGRQFLDVTEAGDSGGRIHRAAETLDALFRPGAFVKWRDATQTYHLPPAAGGAAKARDASIVSAARSIKSWVSAPA